MTLKTPLLQPRKAAAKKRYLLSSVFGKDNSYLISGDSCTYEPVLCHDSSCYECKEQHRDRTNSYLSWYGTGTGRNLGKYCFSLHTKAHNIHICPILYIPSHNADLLALRPGKAQGKWTAFSKETVLMHSNFELGRLVKSCIWPLLPKYHCSTF